MLTNEPISSAALHSLKELEQNQHLNPIVDVKFFRALIGKTIFHSVQYSRDGENSCSFNVSFQCHIHKGI